MCEDDEVISLLRVSANYIVTQSMFRYEVLGCVYESQCSVDPLTIVIVAMGSLSWCTR